MQSDRKCKSALLASDVRQSLSGHRLERVGGPAWRGLSSEVLTPLISGCR